MIQAPQKWTREAKQGEQLPDWEVYLTDLNNDDITTYDVKIIFRKGGVNALVLFPTSGMVKTGARAVVDYRLAIDFPNGEYEVEVTSIISNGKVYKAQTFLFEVLKSFNNG